MSYGILLTTSSGQVINTSTTPASIYETFVVAGNSTGTKTYPILAGFTIFTSIIKFVAQPGDIIVTTIDYVLGYPRLSWGPSSNGATPANATIVVVVR
jgi:hypothetical protein